MMAVFNKSRFFVPNGKNSPMKNTEKLPDTSSKVRACEIERQMVNDL